MNPHSSIEDCDAFIVRKKGTQLYLPPIRRFRAATSQELSTVPRIFYSPLSAVQAAQWWAEGETHWDRHQDWEGEWDEDLKTNPVDGRKLEDLEIIGIKLHQLPGSWNVPKIGEGSISD